MDSFDELDQLLPDLTSCDALILASRDARGRSAIATIERMVRGANLLSLPECG